MLKKLLFFLFTMLMSVNMMANAYVKVTTTPDSWKGNYLIVYEGDATHSSVAFDGSLTTLDAVNNGVAVTIVDDSIVATDALKNSEFVIDGNTLKSKSGYEIGKTAYSNGLDASTTKHYTNTFLIDENGNAVITASGNCTLKYNSASDQLRFRYYKSGQKAIALYKLNVESTPVTPPTPVDPPVVLGEKTIAEFLELKNEKDTCILTGVVDSIYNTTYGNLYLVDETDTLNIYGILTPEGKSKQFETLDVEINDTLTIKAVYREYNNKPQPKNVVFVSVKKYTSSDPGITTEVSSQKIIQNNKKYFDGKQIIIINDNKKYNLIGQEVQ